MTRKRGAHVDVTLTLDHRKRVVMFVNVLIAVDKRASSPERASARTAAPERKKKIKKTTSTSTKKGSHDRGPFLCSIHESCHIYCFF